jgi:ankyrin repeat protein
LGYSTALPGRHTRLGLEIILKFYNHHVFPISVTFNVKNRVPWQGNSNLFEMILHGRLEEIRELESRNPASIHVYDESGGDNALVSALNQGDKMNADIVRFFASRGLKQDEPDDVGTTARHIVCRGMLVKEGWTNDFATGELERIFGSTARMVEEDLEFTSWHRCVLGLWTLGVEGLLNCNDMARDQINQPDALGSAPIHWAVMKNNHQAVRVLLQNGAKINVRDNDGFTPLLLAMEYSPESANILLKNKADASIASDSGYLPLHYACDVGNIKSVKYILEKVNINQRDENRRTCLHFAARSGSLNIIKYLLQRKEAADINALDTEGDPSLADIDALDTEGDPLLADIDALDIEGEPLIDALDIEGDPPLADTIWFERPKAGKLLLEKGALYYRPNKQKQTILHAIASRGNLEFVEMITEFFKNTAEKHNESLNPKAVDCNEKTAEDYLDARFNGDTDGPSGSDNGSDNGSHFKAKFEELLRAVEDAALVHNSEIRVRDQIQPVECSG